ncbi:MAG: polysaccharide deacetylase family protein [Betaproteobacteria bacterium]|nr:polysaccharide deacetylase family protein [Betaproteobacteria bacterium]
MNPATAPSPDRPSWRPTPVLAASIGLHLAALLAIGIDPAHWQWAAAALLANHALLTAIGLWPRSRLLGPNLSRLPAAAAARGEIALTIDDGPDPAVTPQVLDLLDAHGARATFFCIGMNVERYPDLARDIVRRGHAVENHAHHHGWHFAFQGVGGLTRELAAAQSAIARVTGVAPLLFRAPAGLRSPLLDPVLCRMGLLLASWTRRGFDTVHSDQDTVRRRLLRGLAAGDILLLHDGNAARTAAGTPLILEVLPQLLCAIQAAGLKPVTLRAALR